MVPIDSIWGLNSKVFKTDFSAHTPALRHVYMISVCACVCVHVCVGDAAGRSRGPTGDSTVGRLSVCSPSFLRDGKQPAFFRCVLDLYFFSLLCNFRNKYIFLNIFEQV